MSHLLSVPARFASCCTSPCTPPWAIHPWVAHLASLGESCLGKSAQGYLLDWAGRGVSNLLALLTLLVPFPPLTSASRSKKPRRDTSRRYCMGPAPTYPAIQIPSSLATIPQSIAGSYPASTSAFASPLLPGHPPPTVILLPLLFSSPLQLPAQTPSPSSVSPPSFPVPLSAQPHTLPLQTIPCLLPLLFLLTIPLGSPAISGHSVFSLSLSFPPPSP